MMTSLIISLSFFRLGRSTETRWQASSELQPIFLMQATGIYQTVQRALAPVLLLGR
jgi:hypothetical protein